MKQVFELNLSADQYLKTLDELKKSMTAIKVVQKEIDTSTIDGGKAYAANAAELKRLSE